MYYKISYKLFLLKLKRSWKYRQSFFHDYSYKYILEKLNIPTKNYEFLSNDFSILGLVLKILNIETGNFDEYLI